MPDDMAGVRQCVRYINEFNRGNAMSDIDPPAQRCD
jgi:hypothetical protein